ncbi:hypothetical protein D9M68_699220 [compost metagenome]
MLLEKRIQPAFGGDDLGAQRSRLCLHLLQQLLGPRALFCAQAQGIRQFQHVRRPWKAVELARQGQGHALAFTKIGDLLRRECLDVAALHAGVRRGPFRRHGRVVGGVLGERRRWRRDQDRSRQQRGEKNRWVHRQNSVGS